MFSPSFFDRLEERLELAVYDTNQEYRAMEDIPHSIGHTSKFLHYPDRTVEVPLNQFETEKTEMSITGLKSGAFKAMLEDMKTEIGALQSQGVADVKAATVEASTEIKATVENVKAKLKAEVAEALQEFSEFTNGGPA